jgi:hypothetical protein
VWVAGCREETVGGVVFVAEISDFREKEKQEIG